MPRCRGALHRRRNAGQRRDHRACASPVESVVRRLRHINVHETGATEHIGHKCETVPARDGSLSLPICAPLPRVMQESPVPEHVTVPRMAYISFLLNRARSIRSQNSEALRAVCDEFGMYLFVDGARLAMASPRSGNDVTLPDIARISDAFYIGGNEMRRAV